MSRAKRPPERVTYHVVPADQGWKVTKAGGQRASATASTKQQAIEKGRDLARSQELGQLVIHKKSGEIEKEWTYGSDPRRFSG